VSEVMPPYGKDNPHNGKEYLVFDGVFHRVCYLGFEEDGLYFFDDGVEVDAIKYKLIQ